jgi:hypothetical protein
MAFGPYVCLCEPKGPTLPIFLNFVVLHSKNVNTLAHAPKCVFGANTACNTVLTAPPVGGVKRAIFGLFG